MERFDFLVIGAGIAGLSAAIRLAETGTVLVVTKEELAESNTAYAQGGIAVAMGGDEDVALHLEDTMAAGDGLVNREAAAVLVTEGPKRVEELLEWGTAFDRYPEGEKEHGGELMRTREGAHSLSRILHANGDATGKEIAVSLLRHVREAGNDGGSIELMEWATSVDLMVEGGRVVGATLLDGEGGLRVVRAGAVLLASGGAGQVYSDTTNPAVATGDGIAMAYRAGAAVSDMEFYQFHPTAFSEPGAPRFLLSEALRGEGAYLVNAKGERFMERYHPLLELAPRDVVARAITREGMDGPVYLDMRHVASSPTARDLQTRFPGISKFLARYRLELGRDLIPVRPAAHYLMGGVRTDVQGRTSLSGLYAAGEAACTGVHGANRLASNSLLEGLVFGALAAETMVAETSLTELDASASVVAASGGVTPEAATERWIKELRDLMWKDAGLLRDKGGLEQAKRGLVALAAAMPKGLTRRAVEARNLHVVAELIVASALGREESRGAHFRNDFPLREEVAKHSVMQEGRLEFVA
ncbi:L-aspartate oxidase [Tunturiibacter gelidoferens]|uniref:L-aspartate oxidase n=1 Tax=Tunturiibacter gelidiferens TaxID=3069689 RepID=A0ACC5NY48_9BACT|nr:L-aspartate oxidase [Edaphobacter lichenicola]MBB5339490.1 L-aspartate oxidase [Edaphobacter lichenicola]